MWDIQWWHCSQSYHNNTNYIDQRHPNNCPETVKEWKEKTDTTEKQQCFLSIKKIKRSVNLTSWRKKLCGCGKLFYQDFFLTQKLWKSEAGRGREDVLWSGLNFWPWRQPRQLVNFKLKATGRKRRMLFRVNSTNISQELEFYSQLYNPLYKPLYKTLQTLSNWVFRFCFVYIVTVCNKP